MNKKIYIIFTFLLAASCIWMMTACNDDDRDSLLLTDDVDILSFRANGVDGEINEVDNLIQLFYTKGTDLTNLIPEIQLSAGAFVTPASGESQDLSKAVKYRVTNGNVYKDYNVVATHIRGEILSFSIGKYKGVIDHEAGTIHIRYPKTESVSGLTPSFTITEGATVTPEAGEAIDFTNPVTYTVNYMDEIFTYVVTVELADIRTVAFLGTAADSNAIENDDESAAYEWFATNMPDFEYISFNDIKNGKDLSQFAAIWWHLDGDQSDLPLVSLEPTVLTSLKTYYNEGGSFFFSSWATQYASSLEIPKNGKAVNNIWGQGNTASTVGDDWGICFKGNESHPVFRGLQKPVGVNDKAYLLGKGTKAKGHNAIWSFDSWTEYPADPARWSEETGAVNLASFHWDDNLTERSVLFEYPKSGTTGRTVCIGMEGYDWYNEDGSIQNVYRSNLETLTSNILNYISNE